MTVSFQAQPYADNHKNIVSSFDHTLKYHPSSASHIFVSMRYSACSTGKLLSCHKTFFLVKLYDRFISSTIKPQTQSSCGHCGCVGHNGNRSSTQMESIFLGSTKMNWKHSNIKRFITFDLYILNVIYKWLTGNLFTTLDDLNSF